jgi:hypothetical protein
VSGSRQRNAGSGPTDRPVDFYVESLERAKGFEPSTPTLARLAPYVFPRLPAVDDIS